MPCTENPKKHSDRCCNRHRDSDDRNVLEQKMRDIYTKAGVEVVTMTPEDYKAWMAVAKHSSYRMFSEKVPGGDELLRKALAVQ